MKVTRDLVRRLAAAAGRVTVIAVLGIVLLSVALAPSSNGIVRAALLGFCILAIARPETALLVTTAFVGFGIILSHLAGMPALRVTEVLVVTSLAGFCVRLLPSASPFRRALTDSISAPVVLFAVAAAASAAVWQRVYQLQMEQASAYVQALVQIVSRDYFVAPGDFAVLVTTAVLLEGLGLYVVVKALCRLDATFFDKALRMMTLGGAGLAVMSVVRLFEILLRNPDAIQALRATSVGLRISPQIPDYIAAGSYFALCWLAALGLALAYGRGRLVWLAVGAPLIAGIYLTGSRSVIAASIAGLLIPAVVVLRRRTAAVRSVVAFAGLIVVIMVASYSWMSGRDVAGDLARQSLTVRGQLLRAGVRVIETRPLFGVGVDRFYLLAGQFASPELNALWQGRMNPHNDFLRFGAELGLVGLALFLWILVEAGGRIRRALVKTRDAQLAGLAGGLVAFLVTSLFSNPLMVRDVSYVFWIALGLAVGHSATLQALPDARTDVPIQTGVFRRRGDQLRLVIGLIVGGLLLVSIPARARQELAMLDPARASDGFFEWDTDADGTRWRWTGTRATLYVDGRAQVVEIPLSGTGPSGISPQVEVRVDGRLANRISTRPEWQRLRTLLPSGSPAGPRRIDLTVSPTWVPAEVIPGSHDRRPHGVRVGEVRIIRGPTQSR